MRDLWKRFKCWFGGHYYYSDGTGWSDCHGCGRQIRRPYPTSPDSDMGRDEV